MLQNKIGKKLKKYAAIGLIASSILTGYSKSLSAQNQYNDEINQIKEEVNHFYEQFEKDVYKDELISTDNLNEIITRKNNLTEIILEEDLKKEKTERIVNKMYDFNKDLVNLYQNEKNEEFSDFIEYIRENNLENIYKLESEYNLK